MVYYFRHCMSLHVCPGDFFIILDSRLASCLDRNYPFGFLLVEWIVMPFLKVRPSFPLVSRTEGCIGNCIDS